MGITIKADWASAVYESATNPTITNDGVDTAGLGRAFRTGDTWLNTVTNVLFTCVDNTTSAAIWTALEQAPFVHNVPTTLLVSDNDSHDVITLTAGVWYEFVLKNAQASDGGAYTNWVEGWIVCAAAAGSVASEGGQPVRVNEPILINTVAGKDHLYFRRNSDTAFACKVYVGLRSS